MFHSITSPNGARNPPLAGVIRRVEMSYHSVQVQEDVELVVIERKGDRVPRVPVEIDHLLEIDDSHTLGFDTRRVQPDEIGVMIALQILKRSGCDIVDGPADRGGDPRLLVCVFNRSGDVPGADTNAEQKSFPFDRRGPESAGRHLVEP